jgi:hypothetical protein
MTVQPQVTAGDVVVASPTDPQVEYIRSEEVRLRPCRCPSIGVILGWGFPGYVEAAGEGFENWRIKTLHGKGCQLRMGAPVRERLPAGVIPCPRCGNVAFAMVAGRRRCDGARGCGHVWDASGVAA